ncbi:hypothetical protein [Streptomyces ziwulingensis]|uniref:hypothetical protein n=1 Tax=Streptomyces ziwulingensis TaxID=1045501 RepID=UPI0031EEFFB3
MAVTLLAGCGSGGGSEGADPQPGGEASGSVAARVAVTQAAAKGDLRAAAAAGHLGRFTFTDAELTAHAGPCMVNGWSRTPKQPDLDAVRVFIGVLEKRGWRQDAEPLPDGGGGEGYVLEKDEWTLAVAAGAESIGMLAAGEPAPTGAPGDGEFQGLFVSGMKNGCGAGSATPSG